MKIFRVYLTNGKHHTFQVDVKTITDLAKALNSDISKGGFVVITTINPKQDVLINKNHIVEIVEIRENH